MNKRTFLRKLKNNVSENLSKVFDKADKLTKIQSLRLKIFTMKGKITDEKTSIGETIYNSGKKFDEFPEVNKSLKVIKDFENQIGEFKNKIKLIQR